MGHIIDNGNYFLVARNLETGEIEQLPIYKNWYIKNAPEEYQYRNDIAVIDLITMRFKSKEQLIERLFERGYIKSKNVDVFITHTNRNNRKDYINEYELIFNSNDRIKDLIQLAYIRISDKPITKNNEQANNIMNKFISKCYSKNPFFRFVTNPWSKIDKYLVEKLIEYHKREKIDFSLKYHVSDKLTSYLTLRNIIAMWNIYDELEMQNKNIPEVELGKTLVDDYIILLEKSDGRKRKHEELIPKTNKNYVQGQITIQEHLSNQEEIDPVERRYKEEDEFRMSPFDSPMLREMERVIPREKIIEHLTVDDIIKLSPGDKVRLRLMNIVDYDNEMRRLERKK